MRIVLGVALFFSGGVASIILNVISWRLLHNIDLGGRPRCSRCQIPLTWRQLLPFYGYLSQRGRCFSCQKKLPLYFLLNQVITGVLFGLTAYVDGLNFTLVINLFFIWILILIATTDTLERAIFDITIYPVWVIALVLTIWRTGEFDFAHILFGAILGGLVFTIFYFGAKLAFRHEEEPFGRGDILLAILIGTMLGIRHILEVTFWGMLIAGIGAGLLLLTRQKKAADYLPYGTGLCMAACGLLIWPQGTMLNIPAFQMLASFFYVIVRILLHKIGLSISEF